MKLFTPRKHNENHIVDPVFDSFVDIPLKENTPPPSPAKKIAQSPAKAIAKIRSLSKRGRRPFSVALAQADKSEREDATSSMTESEKHDLPVADSMPIVEEGSAYSFEPVDFDELSKLGIRRADDPTDETCSAPSFTPRNLSNDVEFSNIALDLSTENSAPYVKKVLQKKDQELDSEKKYDDFVTLSDSLKSSLFGDSTFSDVLIKCGPKLEQSFYCHRVILASRSEYFKSVLSNIDHSKIQRTDGLNFRIVIEKPHFSAETFTIVLQYIYSGSIQLSCDNVLDVLELSDDLKLHCLKKICTKYIILNMDSDNMSIIMQMSRRYHAPELTRAAFMFVEKTKNVIPVLRSESICELTVQNLIALIKRDNLPLTSDEEIEVFEAVVRWHEHQCALKEEGKEAPEYDLNEIMKNVRFPLMRTDQLSDTVECSGLVAQPLLFEAYRHHIVPISKMSENKRKKNIDEDQGLDQKEKELKSRRFCQRAGIKSCRQSN